MTNTKRKGFTLIELLIIIAVIGVISFYAIPKFENLKNQALSAQASQQLGIFRSALGIYYAKNHGIFPTYEEVASGSIFGDGIVPYVEVTINGELIRSNHIEKAGLPDGHIDDGEIGPSPGWIYDVSEDLMQADIRINSYDPDPANPSMRWFEY